jgi:hypothetical protein
MNRLRLAFGFLAALGLFVALYGIVGPVTGGAVFADAVVEELGLQKEPDVYDKLTMLYANHKATGYAMLVVLGLLIALPAFFGLWATLHDRP